MAENIGLMDDGYIVATARNSAEDLARFYKIDLKTAYYITFRLLYEARASIVKIVGDYGADNWRKMSISEKSAVCTEVVGGLLNKERVADLIKGRVKSLV
jgi:hypothetical protein